MVVAHILIWLKAWLELTVIKESRFLATKCLLSMKLAHLIPKWDSWLLFMKMVSIGILIWRRRNYEWFFFLLTDDSCQYWLDLENQKISSPYYPNWYFANGIDCEWLITAPENHTISLVFDYFKVTQSNTIFNQNYLSFQYILYFTH